MANEIEPKRRVVTGFDEDGRSIVLSDGPLRPLFTLPGFPTFSVSDLWVIDESPASNEGTADPTEAGVAVLPAAGGHVFRIIVIAPDPPGADMAATAKHSTETVDYILVLSGAVTCVLDDGDIDLRPGDVLIQRGTVHAWSNRGSEPCVVAAVLVDAAPAMHHA
jgi:quercetin dioxygenase-like cupin family protein